MQYFPKLLQNNYLEKWKVFLGFMATARLSASYNEDGLERPLD